MTDGTKRKRQLPALGTLLLYGAAIYQATQYSHAATLIDPSPLGQAGGLVAGLVVNVSLAYAASKIPSLSTRTKDGKPGKRERLANAGMIGLLLLSPLLVAPANYATMQRGVLGGLWYLQAAWAILWASAMDIAIALVGFIDKSLVSVGNDARATLSEPAAKASDAQGRSARRPATRSDARKSLSEKPATLWRCECGETFADRFKYSGHAGKCAVHRSVRAGAAIPVDLPKPEPGRQP